MDMTQTAEEKLGGRDLLNIKIVYTVIVIRTLWYWHEFT